MLTWEMISPADSIESLSHTPSTLQPSRANSLHTAHAVSSSLPKDDPSTNTVASEETRSESEFLFLPDYLILSNCETGRLHHARYAHAPDSFWARPPSTLSSAEPTLPPLSGSITEIYSVCPTKSVFSVVELLVGVSVPTSLPAASRWGQIIVNHYKGWSMQYAKQNDSYFSIVAFISNLAFSYIVDTYRMKKIKKPFFPASRGWHD